MPMFMLKPKAYLRSFRQFIFMVSFQSNDYQRIYKEYRQNYQKIEKEKHQNSV